MTPRHRKKVAIGNGRPRRERKHSEEALLLFRILLDHSADTLEIIDLKTARFLDVNENGAAMSGYTREEYLSLRLFDIDPTFNPSNWPQHVARIREAGFLTGEGLHRRKDGSTFPVEFHVRLVQLDRDYIVAVARDVSARKQAEAMLGLQSAALTAAPNAIVITDRAGSIEWANPAFSALTGYTLAEAIGKNPRDLVKSDKQDPKAYKDLWKTILAGRIWHGELVNRRKDGSLYPDEQTITPLRDADGTITHFIAIKQDLSERRLAAEVLHASEQKFQSVFEQAAVGVVIAEGPRGRFVNVNRRFCDIVGYSSEELLQLSSHDITHPDDIASDNEKLRQVSSGILPNFSREKRYRKKDGSFVWTRVFVAPLDPTEAKPTLRIGVIEDITELKQAEETQRASELRYRRLFESAKDGILILDAETGMVVDVNPFLIELLGFSREEFFEKKVWELGFFKDLIANEANFLELQQKEYIRFDDKPLEAADGRRIDVEFVSNVYLVNDRKVIQCNIRDITEKRLLEHKYLHAQRLESIGMLAAGIAHDLNNVLAPIVFAAPMLRESLSAPGDLKVLNAIERSAGRGAGLVKQILGFVQNATGEFRSIQVKHLARDIVSVIEQTFPKSIQIDYNTPSDLFPVLGDATQIYQVLLNLCVNARDSMPKGGTLRIALADRRLDAAEAGTIPGARPGAWLVIEVADTGTGIPPEVLERIWEPFFTTKDAGKGTGMGLSTVRAIVAKHHGFVELHTEIGRGTTFRVFLPAIESESPGPAIAPPLPIPDGHGELVLVVDDDATVRMMVGAILTKHGYHIVSCADGVEAIAFFDAHSGRIPLVVTDIDMPNLGGLALVRALLTRRPDIRLLAISGLSPSDSDGSDIPAVRDLVDAFLPKPVTANDLLGAVHRVLHPPIDPEI